MVLGSLGIMFGFMYRASCFMFTLPYWYIFLLDKSRWNNHSYMFGLVSSMFLISDANRFWSIDSLIWPKIHNNHVPLWQYILPRFQIFIVYFLAGLKKLEFDWRAGYSMNQLSKHWVFWPFKFFLSNAMIDFVVVHIGGLVIDLFIGFLLFFDKTRPIAFVVGSSFHLMNSQIFSIGMFPWTMLATMPLFCYVTMPRDIFRKLRAKFPRTQKVLPVPEEAPQASAHCIYEKEDIKSEEKSHTSDSRKSDKPSQYHRVCTYILIGYVSWQLFMPYSHFLTRGYNNWTNGLYGYSWDMMVHSWSSQHIKVTYVKKDTGEVGYLKPQAFTATRRWSSHAVMIRQYAQCLEKRLTEHNITNIAMYFDIWRSMNRRFQQRMFDPHLDILQAEWHPFKDTPWVMPLLIDLSDWRMKLRDIRRDSLNGTNYTDIAFVADFPGLRLENYVQPDLTNTTLTVLNGKVIVELVDDNKNITLGVNETAQIPPGKFHNVLTISETPSCYMYIYVNTTAKTFRENISRFEQELIANTPDGEELNLNVTDKDDALTTKYKTLLAGRNKNRAKKLNPVFDVFNKLWMWAKGKKGVVTKSFQLSIAAIQSILTGEPMETLVPNLFKADRTFETDEDGKMSELPPED